MDNLCHTLVGAALGEAGLKRTTRYGAATLMIAANLPDLDVLVFATPVLPVAFRRGWTHGVLAQALLPVLLTVTVVAVARWRDRRRQAAPTAAAGADDRPLRPGWLLLLSVLGIYSHVGLDLLNNYGVRALAPLDWRWRYGDAVFIVDLWLWLVLGAGVWWTWRTRSTAAARGALVAAACYVALMIGSARAARVAVAHTWERVRGSAPQALMVGPVAVTPLRREVIVDAGDHYDTGSFSWTNGVTFDAVPVPKNAADPAVAIARQDPRIQAFLSWSRFPFWTVQRGADGDIVTVGDMRFRRGFGFTMSTTVKSSGR